jgi:hypothetical protein
MHLAFNQQMQHFAFNHFYPGDKVENFKTSLSPLWRFSLSISAFQ